MLAKMGTNGVLTDRPSICEPRRLPRGGRGPKMANRPGVIGPISRQSGAGLAALRRPAIPPLCFPMGAALHDAFPKCRYQRTPHTPPCRSMSRSAGRRCRFRGTLITFLSCLRLLMYSMLFHRPFPNLLEIH